jgi:hypothetical protein
MPQNATFTGARVLNLLNQEIVYVHFGEHNYDKYLCITLMNFYIRELQTLVLI